jgi:hypothetical protein
MLLHSQSPRLRHEKLIHSHVFPTFLAVPTIFDAAKRYFCGRAVPDILRIRG